MNSKNFKIGDTVKGINAGTFRIKGFREVSGTVGANLLPVDPETLMPGRHPVMFLPLDCIRPLEGEAVLRHSQGLVYFVG